MAFWKRTLLQISPTKSNWFLQTPLRGVYGDVFRSDPAHLGQSGPSPGFTWFFLDLVHSLRNSRRMNDLLQRWVCREDIQSQRHATLTTSAEKIRIFTKFNLNTSRGVGEEREKKEVTFTNNWRNLWTSSPFNIFVESSLPWRLISTAAKSKITKNNLYNCVKFLLFQIISTNVNLLYFSRESSYYLTCKPNEFTTNQLITIFKPV